MDLTRLRNIGIVAHIDAGKTTVTERVLFYSGVEHRLGEVDHGTATMDWMEEERERGITITAATTQCPWQDHVIQIIDTPGHVDFTAEVSRSLRVLDGAVVIVCAVAGVQAQTETVLRQARRYQLPWIAVINKMDRQGADFPKAVASLRQRLDAPVIPVQWPIGSGSDFEGVVDLLHRKAFVFSPEDQGRTVKEIPLPSDLKATVEEARGALVEAVAETDEELLEKFLLDEDLSAEDLHAGLRQAVRNRQLVPGLCASALRNVGVQLILDSVIAWLPSPLDRPPVQGFHPQHPERTEQRTPDPDGPLSLLVFKLHHQVHGDLHYVRVFSGTLKEGDSLHNARHRQSDRVQQIYLVHADHRERWNQAGPGSIVVLSGLKRARTGDTLFRKGEAIALEAIEFPEPVIQQALEPQSVADRDKLLAALQILDREDPTLHVEIHEDTGQAMMAGMGELHLEVALHRLERDFRVRARAHQPLVAYRETIDTAKEVEASVDRPHGEGRQSATVRLSVEPQEESKPESDWTALAADLPGELREALPVEGDSLIQASGERGYPLAKLRLRWLAVSWQPLGEVPPVELVLGAAGRALDQALEANSVKLQPVMALRVETPEEFLSGVLADLNVRRAEVQDLQIVQGDRRILARVPLAEMFSYSNQLRSLTQGRGTFSMEPEGYAPASDQT
ncbi:MAG: elongation factor G [Planctomycetota bacterium]|nr:MAG: elongation factor G [Planctomycetota bacterium]